MSIMKSRGGLAACVAALALVAVSALAQAPAGGPPGGGPPPGMGMGMGMGMGGPADRPTTIQRMALDDAALKLSAAQKQQIDKLVDGYIAEQKTLAEKYPMAPGSPPSQEGMMARRAARESFTAAVGKVLDDSQRKTWEAALAARRPMGGPGGGMGPPPGNR